MKILALDTSSRAGSICLADDHETAEKKIVANCFLEPEITHAERLLPWIEKILKDAGWRIADLKGLALAIGPGSFTGLRIGLATLKGFAQAHDLPILGVSSLLALAHNASESSVPVAALMDARRGEIYGAICRFKKNKANEAAEILLEEQTITPKNLVPILKKLAPCLLLGDGANAYEKIFREALGNQILLGDPNQMRVHASWVARLALPRLKKGEGKNWDSMVPNYIRKSDAEERKIQKE